MNLIIETLSANMLYYNLTALVVSFVALIVSGIVLIYTAKMFNLKSGLSISASYNTCSSRDCDDKYVSSLTIENLKDRAIVIFKIYLKFGHNNYLELEDHTKKPLILKPFEVYQSNYDPLVYYFAGLERIKIDNLFDDQKVKKTIVLATTNGKYEVKTNIKHWDPIVLFFKNYMTVLIGIVRYGYKDKYYGVNVKYLVELKYADGKEEVLTLHDGDWRLKRFRDFDLTQQALESSTALKKYFTLQKKSGLINYQNINIIEYKKECIKAYELDKKQTLVLEPYGYVKYKLFGKIATIYDIYKTKRENKKLHDQNRKH